MHDLGTLGGTKAQGMDINNSGQVGGYSKISGNLFHAFRYDGTPGSGGVMHDLGTLGGTESFGRRINNAGQVAGWALTTGNTAIRAFRYDGMPGSGGAMQPLGAIGGNNSWALDINDSGFVVGEADRASGSAAVLWKPDLSVVDLDSWLNMTNPTLGAFWTLEEARGISESGLITGEGIYNDGPGGLSDGQRVFILDASSLIPEPSATALLAIGAMALVRRRDHR